MTNNNCFGHNHCNNPIVFPDCCNNPQTVPITSEQLGRLYFTKLFNSGYCSVFANPSDANRLAFTQFVYSTIELTK